jgi:hypothetical protein
MIVAPPYYVQQRAWERAYQLREEHGGQLPIEHRVFVEVSYRAGPDCLGWEDIAQLIALYAECMQVRV